jgi:hypothetical protein
MDAKEKFLQLKQQWIAAKGDEKDNVQKQFDDFFNSLSESDKEIVRAAVEQNFAEMHKSIRDINDTLDIRDILQPVLPAISLSYIAQKYFGKSRSWLTQRINGNSVNGKPAQFSNEEKTILRKAIKDVARSLDSVAVAL